MNEEEQVVRDAMIYFAEKKSQIFEENRRFTMENDAFSEQSEVSK